jgi:hypothetical protein
MVLWAARLLLISAAFVLAVGGVYVIVSTLVRMRNREWLRRAGPFEVSELSLDALAGQVEYWREQAWARQREVELAEQELDETDQKTQRFLDIVDGGW